MITEELERQIRAAVRDVPDFPKPGIMFKDITPLLADPQLFLQTTTAMAAPYGRSGITHVAAIESRGFLLGAPIAQQLGAGLIPVRKPGKLPSKKATVEYQLEYGTDKLEIHSDSCDHTARVLIVDDVLATGGTARATRDLVRGRGAELIGFSFLMAIGFLNGARLLADATVHQLIIY